MAPIAEYDVRAEMHNGKTLEIELSEEDIGRWSELYHCAADCRSNKGDS